MVNSMDQVPCNCFGKSRAFVNFIYLFNSNLSFLTGTNSQCIIHDLHSYTEVLSQMVKYLLSSYREAPLTETKQDWITRQRLDLKIQKSSTKHDSIKGIEYLYLARNHRNSQ